MPSKMKFASPGEMGSATFTQQAADAMGLSLNEYLSLDRCGDKWCYGCRKVLPRTDFRRNNAQPDGLRCECRACHQKQKNAAKARRAHSRAQGLSKTSAELVAGWLDAQDDVPASWAQAAARIDVSVEDYAEQRLCGRKWCYKCSQFVPVSGFRQNRSKADGLGDECKRCRCRVAEGAAR